MSTTQMEHRWQVHVHGPDDVLPATDEADAQRQADEINALELEYVSAWVAEDDVCRGEVIDD